MTDLIARPAATGKTTELIRRSAETFAYIVCAGPERIQYVRDLARQLGLDIPFPLTAAEFFTGRFNTRGIRGFLLDDIDDMITTAACGVPVLAATWTTREDATPRGDAS